MLVFTDFSTMIVHSEDAKFLYCYGRQQMDKKQFYMIATCNIAVNNQQTYTVN